MKNIGVFVNESSSEYTIEMIDGISDYFRGKDVRLILAQTRTPHCDTGIYEYHYWSCVQYFNNTEIDALIIVCGEYTSTISIPKLSSALSHFKKIPVISIGQELFLAKNCFTHADCKGAFNDVISHLKNVHNCKRIAFFSANQTNSEEALERLEAFKAALKANELFFNRSLVLNGNFTEEYAYDELLRRYKSKNDINFDAIICVNDLTAIGCQYALQRIGVSVPGDVKVIGFDDSSKAELSIPKLSTLNQNIYQQGAIAAELAYNVVNDKTKFYTRTIKTPVSPIYRQSCGCIPLSVLDNVYKNQHGDTCYKNAEEIRRIKIDGEYYNYLHELQKVYFLYALIHSDASIKQLSYTMRYLLENADMTSTAVCLFDEPVTMQPMDDFELPRNMNISMLIDIEKNIEIVEPNISFNPSRNMFHEEYFDMESGNYIFSPIFSGEKHYGYIICKVKKLNFAIYSVILKVLMTTIAQACEYTALSEKNQKLTDENILLYQSTRTYSTKSKIDSLTCFLNRRGFSDAAQQHIDMALDSNCTGLVIYIDVDNTKIINDQYGNETGDAVIKAMGTVLGRALWGNDVIGRISGDKFAAVAIGLEASKLGEIRERIKKECIKISREKHFDFLISCTIGAAEFNKINSSLKNVLEDAEKSIYQEKDEKHLSNKLEPVPVDFPDDIPKNIEAVNAEKTDNKNKNTENKIEEQQE